MLAIVKCLKILSIVVYFIFNCKTQAQFFNQECRELEAGERISVYDLYSQLMPLPRKYFLEKTQTGYEIYLNIEFSVADDQVIYRHFGDLDHYLLPNESLVESLNEYQRLYLQYRQLSKKEQILQIKKWEMEKIFIEKTKVCFEKYRDYITNEEGSVINLNLISKEQAMDWDDFKVLSHNVSLYPKPYRSNTRGWSDKISCETIIHESFHYLGLVDEYKDEGFHCRHHAPDDSLMAYQKVSLKKEIKPFVLYPAQFRLITRPYCDLENEKYIQCSKNSYAKMCIKTPSYCEDQSFLE